MINESLTEKEIVYACIYCVYLIYIYSKSS